jgi:hypothetical protein
MYLEMPLRLACMKALKQFMAGGHDTSQLGMGALLTSGGIAGAASWTLCIQLML